MTRDGGAAVTETAHSLTRRPAYAANPVVGERGRRAYQRMLAGALAAFDELGYERCNIGRVAELAGCSRASIYQYFTNKEEIYRHLLSEAMDELIADTAAAAPITGDRAGHDALRSWFAAFATWFERHRAVLIPLAGSAGSDEQLIALLAARASELQDAILERLVDPAADRRLRRTVAGWLPFAGLASCELGWVLAAGLPAARVPPGRHDAVSADVWHRVLFGRQAGINVRPAPARRLFTQPPPPARPEPEPRSAATAAILAAAQQAFVDYGYHGAKVEDIAAAAGTAKGAIYLHFASKEELFRSVNVRGGDQFAAAFDRLREVELGTPNTAEQLDRWLRDYARTFSEISELTRVWQDALDLAPELVRDAAATIYQACRAVAQFLGGRERGDAHGEAIVFMALLVSAHMPHRASVGRRELSPALTRGFMLAATDRGD